ncbi:MAG TPA: ATP-dependent helicase HrpB [Thermoanaerobaculia bacterium]|jgi:ATP-dependent helicase HrpB|nr:ATP-dependent helicase HrpB [Thermoanaerobaculia bacterium]
MMAPAMPPTLAPLPIDSVLPELIDALRAHPNAVLRAPTGAGKTTRVPPSLLAAGIAGLGAGKSIVMTEPRRVAARAAARRIAEEQGWVLGREVGYQVRFERKATRETRILVVTEGILVQRLQADPFLEGVGVVIFDEIHERTLSADLALAMARRVQREVRPDLALVAMSATFDPGPLAEFLGGAPTIDSPGRLHPIEIRYLEGADLRTEPREIAARVASAVERALAKAPGGGGVLAFLPGVGEIRRVAEILAPSAVARGCAILPLYGELPAEAQDAAISPGPRRKIVLATNVAETSVTVSGISVVVDCGLARILRYDPASGLDRLELARIGRASAAQRSGRAGRENPGIAYRLWPEREQAARPERERPEIQRVDLAGPALQLLAWGETDLSGFGWFEPPDPAALDRGLDLLERLGAMDPGGNAGLSKLGRAMAEIPIHPRLARLLIEGRKRGVGREAALVAALLGERDPFRRSAPAAGGRRTAVHVSRSDLLDRLDGLEIFARSNGRQTASPAGELAPGAARFVLQAAEQLERSAANGPGGKAPTDRDGALLASIAAAWPDRIARRREPGSPRAVMVGGRGVRLGEESSVSLAELFACIDLDAGGGIGAMGEARVRIASAVEPGDLPRERLSDEVEVEFDSERERVIAYRRTRFDDLVLSEREVPPPAEDATRVLAEAAGRDLTRALALDEPEIAGFLARWRWLRTTRPELDLPAVGDEEIRALLPELSRGRRSFADLRKAPLRDLLSGALSYPQAQALAREAPERIEVPSGSLIRLDYPAEGDGPPVLAVRIQELFGLTETPRVAAGRVPVLLHLLAPNYRPQQVTRDLASFWANTYPQVKKELQGRYPKHAWPDDPRNAVPERRPRRRS